MSFKVKQPKVADPPPAPAPAVSNEILPQTERQKRLSSGGRQSTFLGGLGAAALPQPRGSLTGVGG